MPDKDGRGGADSHQGLSVGMGSGAASGSSALPPLDRILIMTEVPEPVLLELISSAVMGAGAGGSSSSSGMVRAAGGLPPLLAGTAGPAASSSSTSQGGTAATASTSVQGTAQGTAATASEAGGGAGSSGDISRSTSQGATAIATATSPAGGIAAALSLSASASSPSCSPSGLPWSGHAAMPGALPDMSKADVAVFVFDSSDLESWHRAVDSMVALSSLPGCDTLPCVLVAAKDDLGMADVSECAWMIACMGLGQD